MTTTDTGYVVAFVPLDAHEAEVLGCGRGVLALATRTVFPTHEAASVYAQTVQRQMVVIIAGRWLGLRDNAAERFGSLVRLSPLDPEPFYKSPEE